MLKSIFIYWTVFLISIAFALLYDKSKHKILKNLFFILAIALPVILATIRYGVGIDFFSYEEVYDNIKDTVHSGQDIISYYQEPLDVIINIIADKLFNSYHGFLFISSLLVMIFAFKGILNFKDKMSISLAYFIFFMVIYHVSYNGIRQVISAMIIFYAYKYIINKDFKKFVFFVILAGLFHKSAFFAILLYFVWIDKGKKEKNYYLVIGIITILIPILIKVISYICSYLNIYQKYFVEYEATATYGFLLYIVPLIVLILLNNKNLSGNADLQIFFERLYVLQIPLQLIGNSIAYADRLSLYALPSQIILIPIFLRRLNKNKALNTILVILWYIFYYVVMYIILNSNGVYPYQTIF